MTELFRLSGQEKELLQHFRIISKAEQDAILGIVRMQAQRVEEAGGNIVLFAEQLA